MEQQSRSNQQLPSTSKPEAVGLKKRRSGWRYFLVAAVAFAVGVGGTIGVLNWQQSRNTASLNLDTLWKAYGILQQKYDGEMDAAKQSQGAAAGLVASLGDPYTTLLDSQANEELNNDLKGELSGIGVEIGIKNNKLTVIAPIGDSPAQKAGIKTGDYIVSIDGKDAAGFTLDDAVKAIRGQAGTTVKLGVVRGSSQVKEYEITRQAIQVPSVTTEVKEGNIGYIKIRRFGEDTVAAVRQAVTTLKQQNVKAVVIDVRDNPGGYLDGAIKISSQFMSSGVVVTEKSKHMSDKSFSAVPGGQMTDIPIVILINGGSASASEIMAGALHDNGRATLVGEKTYGKGSVQEIVCLSGVSLGSDDCKGDALKVTVAHWYTPNGANISKEGIKPDIEVKADDSGTDDPQLTRALEVAKNK